MTWDDEDFEIEIDNEEAANLSKGFGSAQNSNNTTSQVKKSNIVKSNQIDTETKTDVGENNA